MLHLRLPALLLTLVLIFSFLGGCAPTYSSPLTDDLGRPLKLTKTPQRIVSILPSGTEILFELGLGERVVGVDEYSDYPEEAKAKPKVGGYYNPNLEKVVALQPDLVVTDGSAADILAGLEKTKLNFVVLKPKDFEGIIRNIQLLGELTGSGERASSLVSDMRRRQQEVAARAKNASRPRVFYVVDATTPAKPWTAGSGSFVDVLIGMAGGENIAASAPSPWVQLSLEEVVRADPEIIVFNVGHGNLAIPKEVLTLPGWRETSAVKKGRVYPIDADIINRPGPRIIQALEYLAKEVIHPELWK